MKQICLIIHIINFVIIVFSNNIFAQWTEIGPSGGWITCMKSLPASPHKLFCGVLQGGAYFSENRGQHWSLISEIGEQNPVYDLSLISDNTIYFATKQGLFFSQNSGESWKKILNASTWRAVAINNTTVAVDTSKAKKSNKHPTNKPWIISYNNGQNWQYWQGTIDNSITYTDYLLPHEKNGNIIIDAGNQIYRTEGLRVFKTINDNWTEWQVTSDINPEFFINCHAFLYYPDSGKTIYAFAESYDFHPVGWFDGGIFKSEDGCQSWTRIASITSATAMSIMDDTIFIGKTKGESSILNSQLYSYNMEDQSLKQRAQFGGDITAIDAERWDLGELLVATESGIFKTENFGETWFLSSSGISRTNSVAAQVVLDQNNNERIIVAVYKGGIWSSQDDGNSWQCQNFLPYILPGLLQKAPNDPQYLYAAGTSIYRSKDYGDSWNNLSELSFPAAYYGWYARAIDISVDPNNSQHAFVHYFDHSMDDYRGIICGETFDHGNIWTERTWFSGRKKSSHVYM